MNDQSISPAKITEQAWADDVPPLVSICCLTYNQIRYVRKAIESFLSQVTTFRVEVILHDDASTDGTQNIIQEYHTKYPDLIVPILQMENQYSKGRRMPKNYLGYAQGEYVAFCHGDDYWLNTCKLQRQLGAMMEYGVGISGHPALVVLENGDHTGRKIGKTVGSTTWFSPCSLLRNQGNLLPYGSIMIDKTAKNDMMNNMPPVRFHTGIQILSARKRGLLVLPDLMSAYRVNVPGSTTELILSSTERIYRTNLRRIDSIMALRELYRRECSSAFDRYLENQLLSVISKSMRKNVHLLTVLKKQKGFLNTLKLLFVLIKACSKKLTKAAKRYGLPNKFRKNSAFIIAK